MEEGGDDVLRGARVQDARLTGWTSHRFRAIGTAQPETYLPEKTEEGRAEQEELVESPPPSVVHVGGQRARRAFFRRCPGAFALVHLQEALTDPGVSASGDDAVVRVSGDDALDLRVVGQVAHGDVNVYANALALDIKARPPEEILNLNMLKMSDEILFRSIKAASKGHERAHFKR